MGITDGGWAALGKSSLCGVCTAPRSNWPHSGAKSDLLLNVNCGCTAPVIVLVYLILIICIKSRLKSHLIHEDSIASTQSFCFHFYSKFIFYVLFVQF